MRSPFPGMNPYLEQSLFWSEFHSRLIVALADAIAPQLRPKYYVGVETRTYLEPEALEVDALENEEETLLVGIPDAIVLSTTPATPAPTSPQSSTPSSSDSASVSVAMRPLSVRLPMPIQVKERYLEVRKTGSNEVITVIEVLSPKNKRKGEGREIYEKKRQRILSSRSHLVEIDLLRAHAPLPMQGVMPKTDYRILVSRSQTRPRADLYAFVLAEPIPDFPLPLQEITESLLVQLQEIVDAVYERGSYDLRIDYRQPVPPPALPDTVKQWVSELLAGDR